MKTVWTRLREQLIGTLLVIPSPVVLDLELSQLLRSGERRLKSVHPSSKVVLLLVKHLFCLEYLENPPLAVESFLLVEEFGQLLDVDVGLRSLSGEQFAALRSAGLEVLDPLRGWYYRCHGECEL